jgi:hypothetical protein
MSSVFATAADASYGYHLLNLLGSIQVNSPVFDRVVAYDLGLDPRQRELLDRMRGVEVRTVQPFVPHWRQGFTWKPWIWTNLGDGDTVFYLDAGATVLRSLGPALDQVRRRGYVIVSQGNELRDIVPPDYFDLYGLRQELGGRPYVAAGIIGFATGSAFYERVIVPTYEDCLAGRNLGFSPDEVEAKNVGLGRVERPIVRACRHFRWDQTLLNIHLAKELPEAVAEDIDEYAGVRSPSEHPQQVIWAHRRQGNLRYLKRIRYRGRGALRARAFGVYWQVRWRHKLRGRLMRSETYVLKARKLLMQAQARARAHG